MIDELDYETCNHFYSEEPHSCPYKEEINDDPNTLCTCCETCVQSCSDNI